MGYLPCMYVGLIHLRPRPRPQPQASTSSRKDTTASPQSQENEKASQWNAPSAPPFNYLWPNKKIASSILGNASAQGLPLKHSASGTVARIEGAKTTGANTPTNSRGFKFFARWTSFAAASAPSLPQSSETTALVDKLDRLVLADLDDEGDT